MTIAAAIIGGCQLVPNRPEAVFDLYRERMKSQDPVEARKLLSEESRKLIQEIDAAHNLQQRPTLLTTCSNAPRISLC
jgi:hypothetical protein